MSETYYKFSPEQRQRFRAAITGHSQWDAYRKANGLNSAMLDIAGMVKAAQEFRIDPANYGTAKMGTPKPRPYGPEMVKPLQARYIALNQFSYQTPQEYKHATDILHTVLFKQNEYATEGQYRALERIISAAEAKAKGEEPTTSAYERAGKIEAIKKYRLDYGHGIRFLEAKNAVEAHWPNPPPPYAPKLKSEDFPQPETKDDIPMPAPAPLSTSESDKLAALRLLMAGGGLSETQVIDLIHKHSQSPAHITIDLRTPELPDTKREGLFHYRFPLLLAGVNAAVNLMLVGPAGSGKTTACAQAAEMLGLEFHFTGAIDSAYKLSGFIDAQGRFVSTSFRKAFQDGGLFLFDEMDASLPGAVLAFNAALANEFADFPDGQVKRHKNFRAVAACNTFGRGADRQYVGRLQLDAATLDRYAMLEWLYDPALESALINAPKPEGSPSPASILPLKDETAAQREANRWIDRVRKVRAKIETQKIRHVVSPRATVTGAKLLAAGWQWNDVEEAVIFKGLDTDARTKIAA